MRAGKSLFLPLVLLGVLWLPTLPALSQNAVLEEVVVTARKRQESALEVPESISSFTSSVIESGNLRSLKDIGLIVPNLYMSTRLDGYPNVSMRGMGAFGNTQGVGFYLDDVQLFSDASSRFGDLERIEVLKGPQGVLYGGSNIGGAVKFVSVRPDTEASSGKAKLGVGEDGFLDVEFQTNIPLSDTWAMRIFGFSETYDGFLSNPGSVRANGQRNDNDEDVGELDRYGVRATIAGSISDQFSAYFTIRHNDLDAPNNTWSRELSGVLTHTNIVDTSFNPRHERTTTAGSLELVYDFSSVTATFITSLTDTDSERQSDLDIGQEWVLDLLRPEELKAVTAELRLSSSDNSPLQWQVGAYYLNLERDLSSLLNVTGGFCYLDPGTCDPAPPDNDSELLVALPFEVSDRERNQLAAFANMTYRWDRWELGLGIRADDWETKRANLDSGLSGKASDTEILGRGSLTWFAPDDSTIVYGTVSQGFEPGDFNLANFAGENALFGFNPEEATQFEVGYKSRLLDGAMSLTVAAFLIDYTDRQFELQAADPSGGFVEGIVNVGDSEQLGVEVDLVMAISENLVGTLGFGWLDAEWDSGVTSPVTDAELGGMTPPNTADFSAMAALDYQRDLGNGMRVTSRLQLRYKDRAATNAQFFDAPGDEFPFWDNPDFTVVDFNIGLGWNAWQFAVHVENLFDEDYYVDAQEFPNFAGSAIPGAPGSVVIGTLEQPRRAVASVTYNF